MSKKAQNIPSENGHDHAIEAEQYPAQINMPPQLAQELLALNARKHEAIERANADFNRDAGLLMRGFMTACTSIDPSALYVPSDDFSTLTRQSQ